MRSSTVTTTTTVRVYIDGLPILEFEDTTSPHLTGTVRLQVDSAGSSATEFDDVVVMRLTGRGILAEELLAESFVDALPADWTFVDGTAAWALATTGHQRLDLRKILNVTFTVDYQHGFPSPPA